MQEGDLIQVAYVVRDLEGAMKFYVETMGIKPWAIYTFAPPVLERSMVRGKPSNHTYRIALAQAGPVQLELIQPLTGRSTYDEFLEKKGEGVTSREVLLPRLPEKNLPNSKPKALKSSRVGNSTKMNTITSIPRNSMVSSSNSAIMAPCARRNGFSRHERF